MTPTRRLRLAAWVIAPPAFGAALWLGLTALGGAIAGNDAGPPNTDPRLGWVEMEWPLAKICDGTTLVYTGRLSAMSTVPNSPECAR